MARRVESPERDEQRLIAAIAQAMQAQGMNKLNGHSRTMSPATLWKKASEFKDLMLAAFFNQMSGE